MTFLLGSMVAGRRGYHAIWSISHANPDWEHSAEGYRLTWRSLSRHNNAVVQIGSGKNISLDWARNGFGANGRYRCGIEAADWNALKRRASPPAFGRLTPRATALGATWLIEGRRRDVYRAVRRWSPRGAIYDLGRTFFDIAGPPIAYIRLYSARSVPAAAGAW